MVAATTSGRTANPTKPAMSWSTRRAGDSSVAGSPMVKMSSSGRYTDFHNGPGSASAVAAASTSTIAASAPKTASTWWERNTFHGRCASRSRSQAP